MFQLTLTNTHRRAIADLKRRFDAVTPRVASGVATLEDVRTLEDVLLGAARLKQRGPVRLLSESRLALEVRADRLGEPRENIVELPTPSPFGAASKGEGAGGEGSLKHTDSHRRETRPAAQRAS